jgi:DNA-binding GntR family transcriptional regulator
MPPARSSTPRAPIAPLLHYLPERVESSVAEHREILEAMRAGDAEQGERLARAHADHVRQDALEFTRRRPEHARLTS